MHGPATKGFLVAPTCNRLYPPCTSAPPPRCCLHALSYWRTNMFKRSLIAALSLIPAIGFAADNTAGAKGPRAAGHFSKADTDGNGTLSRAEVEKAMPHLLGKFESIDTNKDGQLSRGEFYAWKKAHRGER